MNKVFIGEVIKRRRKDLNITQARLCEGICDTTTLSRIEHGTQKPSIRIIQALLERLGLTDEQYFAFITKDDENIEYFRHKIISDLFRLEASIEPDKSQLINMIKQEQQELLNIAEKESTIIEQFTKFIISSLQNISGESKDADYLSSLFNIIEMTIPDFNIEQIGKYVYTHQEIVLINCIASAYSKTGKTENALQMLNSIFDYLSKINEKSDELLTLVPLISLNYVRELCRTNKYNEAINIATYGLDICRNQGVSHFMPGLMHEAAKAYYHLQDLNQCHDFYIQAYCLYKTINHQRGIAEVRNEFFEIFNKDPETLFFCHDTTI